MLKSKFFNKKTLETDFVDIIDFVNNKVLFKNNYYDIEDMIELKHTGLFDINHNSIFEKDIIKFNGMRGIVLFILGKFVVEITDSLYLSSTYFSLSDVFYDCIVTK